MRSAIAKQSKLVFQLLMGKILLNSLIFFDEGGLRNVEKLFSETKMHLPIITLELIYIFLWG